MESMLLSIQTDMQECMMWIRIVCHGVAASPTHTLRLCQTDGEVIGYHTIPADNQGNIQRRGFIWTENLGYIEFKDFIAKYLTDISLPTTNNFDTQYMYDVPISISGDGTLIGGWSGYTATTRWGWALKLDHAIVVPERPRNLTAKLDIVKRNEVTLNPDY